MTLRLIREVLIEKLINSSTVARIFENPLIKNITLLYFFFFLLLYFLFSMLLCYLYYYNKVRINLTKVEW